MDSIIQAITNAAIPVLTVLVKGIVAAIVVGGMAQLSVERLIAPFAASDKTPAWLTPLSSEAAKRTLMMVGSQAAVVAAHWSDVWTFGAGPKGWGAAVLFGFLGGGLTPWFINQVSGRATASAIPASPEAKP